MLSSRICLSKIPPRVNLEDGLPVKSPVENTNRSRDTLLMISSGILIGIGVVVLIYFLFIDQVRLGKESSDRVSLAPEVGLVAPPFELQSLAGESVRLSDLRGKPVILNFWATWCGPCRLEMPVFQEYQDEYGSDLVILTVNSGETEGDIVRFLAELDLDLTVLLDEDLEVGELYRVMGLPSTFFMDGEGVIRFKHLGVITKGQVEGYLREMGYEYD